MQKILLNKKLSKKYSSQLEYMGHMNLEKMDLPDGKIAVIENGNFYICNPKVVAKEIENLAFQLHVANSYSEYELVDERA